MANSPKSKKSPNSRKSVAAMIDKKGLFALITLTAALVVMAGYNRPYRWWPVNDMSEQPIIKPFNQDGLRAPAEGSVSLDEWEPIPLRTEIDEENFTNPIEATEASIAAGKALYETYCWSCHGTEMSPNPQDWSPVQQKGMPGANILLVKTRSDAWIYSTLTHGGAIMKRVSYHLSPEERWHVINYIRSFQDKY